MTSSQSQDGTASHSSKGSDRQASSRGDAGSENGLLQKLRRVSRIVWLSLSAAVLVIGSLAWHFDERQWETRSHGIEHLRSTSESWLSRPRVYQAEAALPDISGRLYAVSVQRDVKTGQNRLWAAGAGGLLAYSDDDGQCWTRLDYANDRGEFREPETNPCSQPSKTAEFRLPGLIPRVLAAAPEESSSPKQSKPSAKPPVQQAVPNAAAQTSQSGAGVEVFPTTLDFGDVALPDSKSGAANTLHYLFVTVANRTQESALVSFGGFRGDTSGEFEIESSEACGAELKPGANCSARVIFHPVKEGLKQVVLPVQTNHSATQSIRIAANVPARSGDADASQRTKIHSPRVDKPSAAASSSTTTPPASLPNDAPRPPASAPDLLAIDFDLNGTIISTGGLEWDQIDEKTWRFRAVKRGTYPRRGGHTWILTGPSGDWATETRIQSAAVLQLPPRRYGCEDCTIRSQWLDPTTKTAWAVGWSVVNGRDHAVILKNGGKGWEAMTRGALPLADRASAATARPWMLPPPWYLFVLLASVALALPALLPPLDKPLPEGPDTVEGRLSSDKPLEPGDPDVLGLNAIALGLSRFLRNEKTLPPLTVAINGEWGTGKSSLMNLLRCDLKSYGMCPVWFNAWHHQKEEHLLAALLQTVRLEAVPPIWNLLGVPFRARLLTHWLRRRWAQMVALVAALTFLVMLDFHLRFHDHSDLFLWITGQFFPSSGGQASGALSTVPIQGGVVALLATVAALWKGLTAFGANPASLLASVAQGNKMKDLEAQTSFRQKFAIEFRNFTRALGPRRPLVVFIDDLDRCLPANVRDVLEAVNFLVSSGDCFVILGMDKVQVQRAVGLSFKDVADEITLKPMPSGNGAAQFPDSAGDAGRLKRAEFAQKYLEKLINLEVRVPLAIDDATKRGLFKPAPEKRPERLLTRGLIYGLQAAQWAVPVALAVLLLAGAYQLSVIAVPAVERWMDESRVMPAAARVASPLQLSAASSPETTETSTKPGGAVAGEGRTSEPANGSTNPALGELLSAVPGETPAISSGREVWPTRWLLSIPIYLLVVFLLLVANVVLTTRPGVVTCDSQPFADAMEGVWYPLVLAKQNTPRAAKRFVNRVRYLAMRQRTFREHSSWWERALFPQRLREPDQVEGGKPIPEPLLVAMAAMEQMEPTWIYDQKVFNDLVGTSDGPGETLKFPSDNPIAIELLQAAREAHRKKFSTEEYSKLSVDWQFLPTYRNRFLVIWPQIDPADA